MATTTTTGALVTCLIECPSEVVNTTTLHNTILMAGPSRSFFLGCTKKRNEAHVILSLLNEMRPMFSSCSLVAQPTTELLFIFFFLLIHSQSRERELKKVSSAYGALAVDWGRGRGGNEQRIKSTSFFKSKAEEF
jgi:hypothetical protein